MNKIVISNLADYPEQIPVVARWLFDQWSAKHGAKLEDIIHRTERRSQKDRVPMTLIAFNRNRAVGTVALWKNDLQTRPDLTPYLATLYVIHEERKKGIGYQLVKVAIAKARELGYKKLYLIAEPDMDYYAKRGWRFLANEVTDHKEPTKVFEYDL